MANQLRVTLISTELTYIVFAVSGFCSTIVNARPPGNWRLFSYEATAQTKVTPHQHPHPKKLRNLFPTSVHSLLTQHNSFLNFTPSALRLGRCVPTTTPA